MANVVRKEMYVKSDVNQNNNKFWEVQIESSGTVICRWGRVGDTGQNKTFSFGSIVEANHFVDGKIKEKTRDGRNGEIAYRKIDVVGSSMAGSSMSSVKSVANNDLARIATKQIKTNNPIVEDLIRYLTKVNAHNICSFSDKITYNDTTGLFSTPLGIVTQSNIDEANNLLVKIGDLVANRDYTNPNMIEFTNLLLMYIPQNIGRNRLDVREFWSDLSKVQKQQQVLDSLQASLVAATKNPQVLPDKANIVQEHVFDVELNIVDDRKVVSEIFDNYNKRKSSMHTCCNYNPINVWSICVKKVREAFLNDGAKLQNVINAYHGTSSANLLSLLSSGFLVRPPKSAHVSGSLFGLGIYGAPIQVNGSSTKACNYSTNYWGGTSSQRTFVFIVKFGMGNYYTPTANEYQRISYPKNGYQSTWAKGNYMGSSRYSGVINDECIVYRPSQVDMEYLIELKG